eukprot:g23050.t1
MTLSLNCVLPDSSPCSLLFIYFSNYRNHHVPPYVLDSLHQARFWNPFCDIFFYSESTESIASLKIPSSLRVIKVSDDGQRQSSNSSLFDHLQSSHRGLYVHSLQRLFSVRSLMTKESVGDAVLIECDNLVYVDFSVIIPKLRAMYPSPYLAATKLTDKEFSASVLWISSVEAINSFIKWYEEGNGKTLSNEMFMLGAYAKSTGYVFDSASYGQYLDGTESKRIPETWSSREHVLGRFMTNEGVYPHVAFMNYSVNHSIQIIVLQPGGVRLANLHVHTKRTHRYLSVGATWAEKNQSYYERAS